MRGEFGSPADGGFRYPMLEADVADACRCKYGCYPQFHARWEAIAVTREKVGYAEFGDPSEPPRFFLRKRTSIRAYSQGGPWETFWEESDVDPETGEAPEFPETSDPAFTSHPALAATPVVVLETPTLRHTTWTITNVDGSVAYRVAKVEALSMEYTTEQLRDTLLDNFPEWAEDDEEWPGEHLPDAEGVTAYFIDGLCYARGLNLWSPVSEALSVPAVWRLAEDETSLYVQRVRFRLVFPHLVAPCSFRVEWSERFLPDDDDPEDPTNPQYIDADGTAPESPAILEITERQENGENFACCARFIAA